MALNWRRSVGAVMCWLGFAPSGVFPGAILTHCRRCGRPFNKYGRVTKWEREMWVDDPKNFEKLRQNFTTALRINGPNMNLPEMSARLCEMRDEIERLRAALLKITAGNPTCDSDLSGAEIQTVAFDDFTDWQSHQGDDVRHQMPIIQQASLYADDEDWHNRKSDTDYLFRHN